MKLGPRQTKWLRDLPKYEKTEGKLYRPGIGFCCLGVYADTQVSTPWEDYCEDVLEEPDWMLLGLRTEEGDFRERIYVDGRAYRSLAWLNDEGPFTTHAEMADFIRKHTDLIFTHSA